MSEETETTESVETTETETVTQTEPATETNEVVTEKRSKSDPGYDPVDIDTASPEEIKTRLNYLYKQAKTGQKTQSELREMREIAAQQAQVIADLQNGMYQFADHLQNKTLAETEAQLRIQKQQAYETGDYATLAAIDDKLMEIKVQKASNQNKPKPQAKQQPVNQAAQVEEYELDENTEYEGKEVAEAWRFETDTGGNPIRPWAEKGHPEFQSALAVTLNVLNNPANAKLSMEQKLAIVDQRMGVRRTTGHQTVMNGGLNPKPRIAKVVLTPEMERIATKTRFGGPNAKTDADHIAAYRKQLEKFPIRGKK